MQGAYLRVQEGDLLAAEDLGDKGAAGAQHVRDDGERGQDELRLHKLVHVVQARHCAAGKAKPLMGGVTGRLPSPSNNAQQGKSTALLDVCPSLDQVTPTASACMPSRCPTYPSSPLLQGVVSGVRMHQERPSQKPLCTGGAWSGQLHGQARTVGGAVGDHQVGLLAVEVGDDLARGDGAGDVALDLRHALDRRHRLQVHRHYLWRIFRPACGESLLLEQCNFSNVRVDDACVHA